MHWIHRQAFKLNVFILSSAMVSTYLSLAAILIVQSQSHSDKSFRSELYKEQTCPKTPIPVFSGQANYLWLSVPGTWYMPMASERAYRLTAEVLLGRAARSASELDLVDIRVNSLFYFYKVQGFTGSKSFTKACLPADRSVRPFPQNLLATVCYSLWGTKGSDIKPAAKAVDNIVWTDNENAVLLMPCNEAANSLDWFTLTKRPTISEATKATILSEIAKFGFNPKNAAYYDYENQRFIRPKSVPLVSPLLATPLTHSVPVLYTPSAVTHFVPGNAFSFK